VTSKQTITTWTIVGFIAVIPAGILIPSSSLALAARNQGASDAYGRTMVALITLGAFFLLGAVIALVMAWAKALTNLRRLGDTTWFTTVLWFGIAGIVTMPLFGLGAFVLGSVLAAYLLAGPGELTQGARSTTLSKTTIARWATRGFSVAGAGGLLILGVAISTSRGAPLEGVLWPSLALVSLGFTAVVAGSIAVGAAWWGALFNARLLAHNAWFKRLLWSGIAAAATMPLFGFGVLILAVVLIAYRRSAPDSMTVQPTQLPTTTAPPRKLAS